MWWWRAHANYDDYYNNYDDYYNSDNNDYVMMMRIIIIMTMINGNELINNNKIDIFFKM